MLCQSCRLLLRSSSAATTNGASSGAAVLTKARQFSTEVPATAAEDFTFVDAWKKILPNLDPLKTPSVYMKPRPATPTSIPTKLTVNLALPYSPVLSSKEAEWNFPEGHAQVVENQCKMLYRQWGYRLKEEFFNGYSIANAVKNCPSDVDRDEWKWMCEKHWSTDDQKVPY